MKAIHFQIDNTTALSYLVKMAGNQKQVFNRISKVNLEVSPAPWDYNYCRISSKLHEHGGRLAFKKLKRQFRVETLSTSISENCSDQRKTRDRPFCFSTVSTTSTVQYMETRSIQSGNICNAANLVQSVPLCFPPCSMINKVLKKIAQDQVKRMLVVAPTYQSQVWYPTLLRMPTEKPLLLPHHPHLLLNHQAQTHPLITSKTLRLEV